MPAESATKTLHTRSAVVPPLPIRVRRIGGTEQDVARLEGGTLTIGAASSCDLVIPDESVSRRHVELELVPEGVLVRDLGSRNGTYYLGQRVERMIVSPGAMLTLGAARIAIEVAPDAVGVGEPLHLAGFRGMIGGSPAMQALFGKIARLDGSLVPVLLLGETGVGKELVARAIHEGSRVAEGPFVAINCGAIARELVTSMLFGHKRGAFTGATDARRGAFGTADGGTLLLDEIGELPLDVQPMLLRALEAGEITAVGEDMPRRISVRVIASTNRALADEVAAGRFREDLYYRLAAVTLVVPPLRERLEDVPALAEAFARQEGVPGVPRELCDSLAHHPFPGNVRELRNLVRTYVALGEVSAPRSSTFPPSVDDTLAAAVRLDVPFLEQRDTLMDRFSALYVDRLLRETNGNQTAAAKLAGLDRTYFGRLLAKLGRR